MQLIRETETNYTSDRDAGANDLFMLCRERKGFGMKTQFDKQWSVTAAIIGAILILVPLLGVHSPIPKESMFIGALLMLVALIVFLLAKQEEERRSSKERIKELEAFIATPVAVKARFTEGKQTYIVWLFVDRKTGVLSPINSADRNIWLASEEEKRDKKMFRSPYHKRDGHDQVIILGERYTLDPRYTFEV